MPKKFQKNNKCNHLGQLKAKNGCICHQREDNIRQDDASNLCVLMQK